jgi:predicted kinase
MKRAIVLCGVGGTGKTHARLNDPELKDLPFVDIADIYKEFPEIDWSAAHAILERRMAKLLQEHDAVVVEGYFLPGSVTRQYLEYALKVCGAKGEWREFWAPYETCVERIAAQWKRGAISAADCKVRLETLRKCWRLQHEA